MRRLKKISLWTAGIFGSVLALYLVILLLLPQFIDSEAVKKEIRNQFSQMVGGQIKFKRLELFIWPIPHIAIEQVKISIPPTLSSTIKSSKIYPKILPLLTGEVKIAVVRFESPVLDLKLMHKSTPKEVPSEPFEFMDLGRRVAATLAILPEYTLPDLKFEIRNGYFNLFDSNQKIFELKEIQAVFKGPLDERQLNLRCSSNLWQDITVNASADIPALESSGRIDLQGFRPQKLSAYLFHNSGWQITQGRSDVSIHFTTDLPQWFKAEITGSIPYFILQHGQDDMLLRGQRLKAGIEIDKDRVILSVMDLVLDKPQLKISGQMEFTSRYPGVRFRLKGRQIDIGSMRSVLLGFFKENAKIRDLFKIIKGGKIPLVTAEARGKALSDLINTKNLTLRGRVSEAQITIPGLNLELEDVSGDAAISRGILQATNLAMRLGNVVGQNGELDLGLTQDAKFFQLAIGLQADLSQLPPMLEKLIDDKKFRQELSQISELNGNAAGILMLGNTTGNLKVHVKANIANLTARHQRVPYPITIRDGNVTYDRNQIHIDQFQGEVGRSSFSNLSADAYWGKEPYLMIRSGNCRLFLEEIHSWIAKTKNISGPLNDIESLNGVLAISSLRLQGPIFRPTAWMLDLKGEPVNLAVKIRGSPGVIKASGGSFHAVDQALARKLYLKDHNITLLDTSFNVSGTLDRYLKGINGVDLTFEGTLSARGTNWISDILNLPAGFKLRSPLSISNAHLTWNDGEKTTFSGDLAVRDGPRMAADILLEPRRLNIKKLLIQDNRSRAAIGLLVERGKIFFSFNGNLHQQTMDELLADNQILQGWIRGDFRASIHLDRTKKSTAEGKLDGKDLFLPWKPSSPIKIKSLSVAAANDHLAIDSIEMAWNDSQLRLAGKMDFSSRGMLLDIDINADEINWEIWRKTFDQRKPVNDKERSQKSGSLPISGKFQIKTERFRYGKFTWSPWHADVSFNNNAVDVKVIKANLCGISTPADLKMSPRDLDLQVNPIVKGQKLDKTLLCLFGETYQVDGRFSLTGDIKARGKANDLIESLSGNFEFEAKDGRIYRDHALKKTLALLNITEVFLGRIPDFTREGMSYKTMSFTAKVAHGKLVFKKIYLDSPAMKVTGQGTLDILTQKINFNILVAPLRTVDRILGIVPLVGGILQTILTVPVKVEGDIKDPKVTLMDPSVVGSELSELMQDTVQNPIKLIYPGLK